ncbi:MAG TPA: hypothetical protein VIV57_24645 [Anaeromyxobacter sp.]
MKARNGVQERNGVRVRQRVVDVDGNSLGRVDALYDAGFSVVKGLPLLFRSDFVARYDEVREVRGDEIVLARSSRDLFSLARGEIPPSWRVEARPDQPAAATPSEAQPPLRQREPPPRSR